MRLEDKELEGPELEREQRLEKLEDASHERDRELPQHAGHEVESLELDHRPRLFDALQAILAGENLSIPMLYLPQREAQALEALQAAVSGRDRSMNTFVFAEDRASLLEQALSVLQQNLTQGDAATLASLHAKYDELTENVANLRGELHGLEDAQDDLIEQKQHEKQVSGDAPDTTENDADEDESVTGFIASALNALAAVAAAEGETPFRSTLVGPELPDAARSASTLEGPEVEVAPKTSSLAGPDLPAPATHASALDAPGPEVPAKRDHVSALAGPDVAEPEKRSQLYTEGMSALIVPEHLRPRLAEHQPTGMSVDGRSTERDESPPVKDDPRGPKPASSRTSTRDSRPSMEQAPIAKPGTANAKSTTDEEPPSRPTPKPRGLSVRPSEKPNPKTKK